MIRFSLGLLSGLSLFMSTIIERDLTARRWIAAALASFWLGVWTVVS